MCICKELTWVPDCIFDNYVYPLFSAVFRCLVCGRSLAGAVVLVNQ